MKKIVRDIRDIVGWLRENRDERNLIIQDIVIVVVFAIIAIAATYLSAELM